jgi:DNA-binding IclR family transcriptional regulator
VDTRISDVGVLDKAIVLLDAVAGVGGRAGTASGATLTDLVEATGMPRATAHRLLVALEAHDLLRRDGDGRFLLGYRLLGLGAAAAAAVPLAAAAQPALGWLRDETGESAQLYVRQGDQRICVASLDAPRELRTMVPVGAALPLDRGSAGKVLRDQPVLTRGGWAESIAEREVGVASVSAPVCDPRRVLVAAVSVSGPIERLSRQPGRRYGATVIAAANRIESVLGSA